MNYQFYCKKYSEKFTRLTCTTQVTLYIPRLIGLFSIKNVLKNIFGLTQSPNTSKYVSRNKGATMKASRKKIPCKFFLIFLKFWSKVHLFYLKMATPLKKKKKLYSIKSLQWLHCLVCRKR